MIAFIVMIGMFLHPDGSPPASEGPYAAVIAATVRLPKEGDLAEGCGVCIGQRDGYAYLLTPLASAPIAETRPFVFLTPQLATMPTRTIVSGERLIKMEDVGLAFVRIVVEGDPVATTSLAQRQHRPKRFPQEAVSFGYDREGKLHKRNEVIVAKAINRRSDEGALGFYWDLDPVADDTLLGGPLVDDKGKIIGIRVEDFQGRRRFVHLDEILVSLKRTGYGWLAEPIKPEGP